MALFACRVTRLIADGVMCLILAAIKIIRIYHTLYVFFKIIYINYKPLTKWIDFNPLP